MNDGTNVWANEKGTTIIVKNGGKTKLIEKGRQKHAKWNKN